MPNGIIRTPAIDNKILTYVLATVSDSNNWWHSDVAGSSISRLDRIGEYRKRYDAYRSTSSLDSDLKTQPFPRGSSNIGVGAEQIFGEFLVSQIIGNTRDLTPALQAIDENTEEVNTALTKFHDNYHRYEVATREQIEYSIREIFKVGGVFHKWTYNSIWQQRETSLTVWVHPLSNQPMMIPDQGTGQLMPMIADPKTPKETYPIDPATGIPLKIGKIPSVNFTNKREGPMLSIRPIENIGFPSRTRSIDPNDWDYVYDKFDVSPWWFLGREGDPFDGKLQNINLLWKAEGINPNEIHLNPSGRLNQRIDLIEWHGKFPVTSSGKPAEIIALVSPKHRILLGWRLSPFLRRPFFNRQVWNRGEFPIGKGIPETVVGLRDAMDASVNQDTDAGNLHNWPPMLLSELAIVEDEDYETTGPGAQWLVRDINGVKFLPPPIPKRDPMARENWLMSMMQRLWGVTDLNLNAPTDTLSPNVKTATGVLSVLNQGTVKFGHLTRRIADTDTKEYQFTHDMFREMMTRPRRISIDGEPIIIRPEQRQQFFSEDFRIVAVGNGVTTNPALRQQVIAQLYQVMVSNPFVANDPDVLKQLTEKYFDAFGVDLKLGMPQELEQIRIFKEIMATPEGQQIVTPAIQQAILAAQANQNGHAQTIRR